VDCLSFGLSFTSRFFMKASAAFDSSLNHIVGSDCFCRPAFTSANASGFSLNYNLICDEETSKSLTNSINELRHDSYIGQREGNFN
jgi:hypothetical protein